MDEQPFGKAYGDNPAAAYQRFFVPVIGAPVASDLIHSASLRPGERVLDVACGTGVVARLASEEVGDTGEVTGLDINPGMLVIADSVTPAGLAIRWLEGSAEAMPLSDAAFEVVLCQMGLEFIPDKDAALREMRRVLTPGGRLVLNVPGPTPRPLKILGEALKRHVSAESAGFVSRVFSLYDEPEIRSLLSRAGFIDLSVRSGTKTLRLPAPKEFLWQYVRSTPLAGALAAVENESLVTLEHEVVTAWQEFVEDRSMILEVPIVTATARKRVTAGG